MDAALARAARLCLRGAFLFALAAETADAGNRRRCRGDGPGSTRLGQRLSEEK